MIEPKQWIGLWGLTGAPPMQATAKSSSHVYPEHLAPLGLSGPCSVPLPSTCAAQDLHFCSSSGDGSEFEVKACRASTMTARQAVQSFVSVSRRGAAAWKADGRGAVWHGREVGAVGAWCMHRGAAQGRQGREHSLQGLGCARGTACTQWASTPRHLRLQC